MSKADQAPLNGAYHVLPNNLLEQDYNNKPGRPLSSLRTLVKIAAVLIVISLGVAALVLWPALRPKEIKVSIVSASISQFNITGSNTLEYRLSLLMVVRNPNRRVAVYYDWVDADACYKEKRFGWVSIRPLYKGHKNISSLDPVFEGRSVIALADSDVEENFIREKKDGYFNIKVLMYALVRFKVGPSRNKHHWVKIRCDLERVPLAVNGSSGIEFAGTRCYVHT